MLNNDRAGGQSLTFGGCKLDRPRMYQVEVYLRVRRAVMMEGMSIREASRVFGMHWDTVWKMTAYSAPPGYRRQVPARRPKLEHFTGGIDRILEEDLGVPRKQRHTAQRIFERLREEYGFGASIPSSRAT